MRKIVISILLVMLISIVSPTEASPLYKEKEKWLEINNGVMTVLIPSQKVIPFYIFWRNDAPDDKYVAFYLGLAETWVPPRMPFRHKYLFNDSRDIATQILLRVGGNISNEVRLIDFMDQVDSIVTMVENEYYNELPSTINNAIEYAKEIKINNDAVSSIVSDLSMLRNESKIYMELAGRYTLMIENVSGILQGVNELDPMPVLMNHTILIAENFNLFNETINSLLRNETTPDEAIKSIDWLILLLNFTSMNWYLDQTVNQTIWILRNMRGDIDSGNYSRLSDNLNEINMQISMLLDAYQMWMADIYNALSIIQSDISSFSNGFMPASQLFEEINRTYYTMFKDVRFEYNETDAGFSVVKSFFTSSIDALSKVASVERETTSAMEEMNTIASSIRSKVDELRSGGWVDEVRRRMDELRMAMSRIHPFLLPFPACEWRLSEISNITSPDGEIIGMQFSFTIANAPPPWNIMEGDIIIRNRIYIVPVNETIGNNTYMVSRFELKNDIIINHWDWNIEYIRSIPDLNITAEPKLILIAGFRLGKNLDASKQFNMIYSNMEEPMEKIDVRIGDTKIGIGEENELDIHGNMVLFRGIDFGYDGFYRFNPYATVKCENETKTVPVSGVFLTFNRLMRIFIIYPYFGNCSLEHDPSSGIYAGMEEQPVYNIDLESMQFGYPSVTGPSNETIPMNETMPPETTQAPPSESQTMDRNILLAIGVLLTVAVSVAIAYIYSKKKM